METNLLIKEIIKQSFDLTVKTKLNIIGLEVYELAVLLEESIRERCRETLEKLLKINKRSFEENIELLNCFCYLGKRLPRPQFGKEEGRLYRFYRKHKFRDVRVLNKFELYSKNKKKEKRRNFEKNLIYLKYFYWENRRLPKYNLDKEEKRLYRFMVRYKNNEEIIKIKEEYIRNKKRA